MTRKLESGKRNGIHFMSAEENIYQIILIRGSFRVTAWVSSNANCEITRIVGLDVSN